MADCSNCGLSVRWVAVTQGVSGVAASAPTRGGSRKKIGYNEKHTEQENCKKTFAHSNFLAPTGARRGAQGRPRHCRPFVFFVQGLRPCTPLGRLNNNLSFHSPSGDEHRREECHAILAAALRQTTIFFIFHKMLSEYSVPQARSFRGGTDSP